MAKTILFVDDEADILKAHKRLFMQTEYETFYAISGMEALEILDNEKIDLIISATAGLLHDIGRLILLQNYAEKYTQVTDLIIKGDKSSIYNIETSIIYGKN